MSEPGLDHREGIHATDLSANFYTHFQMKKNDITSRLEALDKPGSNANTHTEEVNYVSSKIVALRKDLIDATYYLPSYDRGKCEQQIKVLEEYLSRYRAPKSKFAFKRKSATSSLSPHAPRLTPNNISPDVSPDSPTVAPTTSTTNITLSSRSATHLTLSSLICPASICSSEAIDLPQSSDITLTDIRDCVINLFPSTGSKQVLSTAEQTLIITALHARALQHVLLVIPPIAGSVLLHDVHDSLIVVGCHQFRMHDSSNTTVLLHILSNPIIERSHDIRFGAYPDVLHRSISKSFLERSSKHTMVQDFDWIKPSHSPNWRSVSSLPLIEKQILRVVDNALKDDEVKEILQEVLLQE